MTFLVGGPLHSTRVELAEGAARWVDLRRGHTYHRDLVSYTQRDPLSGRVTHLRKVVVLVFEEVRAIQPLSLRQEAVNRLVSDLALRAWFGEHNDGVDYPIPSGLGDTGNGRRSS